MSYGVNANNQCESSANTETTTTTTATTATAQNANTPVDWTTFNAQLAQLRADKGDDCDEVQQLMKAANESLTAYYNSPAYREWYENYCKQQKDVQPNNNQPIMECSKSDQLQKTLAANKAKYELKPSERMLNKFLDDGDDPDVALARAEAELLSGVQPVKTTDDNHNELSNNPGGSEEHISSSAVSNDDVNTAQEDPDSQSNQRKRKQIAPPPAWYEIDDSKNTHVYVSGLPPTITDDEFLTLMSKCGVIMNEPFTNVPRLKLYKDQNGKPKGDGRCCYIKVESVELALKILDGMMYAPGYTVHVERAKFQPKGEFDPKKRRRLTLKEKKKLKQQQENLFRWGIDSSRFIRGKKERVVILKNAFNEADFQKDVTLIPIVKERLRVQCAKCGIIKKIVVHDAHPEGVVSVTFSTPEEADTGIQFMAKALFDYPGTGGARQLEAERWDGKTNYNVFESKDKEASRLQNWEEYLGGSSSSGEEDEKGERVEEAVGEGLKDAGGKLSISSSTTHKDDNKHSNNSNDKDNEPSAACRRTQLAFDVPSDYWERLSDDEDDQSSCVDTDDNDAGNDDSGAETS
nr:unnamed protein product [Trichobilharzia regenti]